MDQSHDGSWHLRRLDDRRDTPSVDLVRNVTILLTFSRMVFYFGIVL